VSRGGKGETPVHTGCKGKSTITSVADHYSTLLTPAAKISVANASKKAMTKALTAWCATSSRPFNIVKDAGINTINNV
jgi:hypothetical protein